MRRLSIVLVVFAVALGIWGLVLHQSADAQKQDIGAYLLTLSSTFLGVLAAASVSWAVFAAEQRDTKRAQIEAEEKRRLRERAEDAKEAAAYANSLRVCLMRNMKATQSRINSQSLDGSLVDANLITQFRNLELLLNEPLCSTIGAFLEADVETVERAARSQRKAFSAVEDDCARLQRLMEAAYRGLLEVIKILRRGGGNGLGEAAEVFKKVVGPEFNKLYPDDFPTF